MAKKLKTEGKKKKEKWNLFGTEEREENKCNAHIEVLGSSRISIDGCLGVYEYKDTYLKLRLLRGSVIICGSEFNIIYFENRLISVKGNISSIEFV